MKVAFFYLVLFPSLLFSQSYLNVHYSDGTTQNTSLGTLTKITFDQNSGQVSFYCTDIGIVSKSLSTIQKFTFDNSGSGGLLPVELSSFTGSANGQSVSLTWVTLTEKNSNKFEIQRRLTTTEWEAIGFVKAAVLSNSPRYYSATPGAARVLPKVAHTGCSCPPRY